MLYILNYLNIISKVLASDIVEDKVQIKRIIFSNDRDKNTIKIDLTKKVIIENITLVVKNDKDESTDKAILNTYIIEPTNYNKKVMTYTNSESKHDSLYKQASTNYVKIDLSNFTFTEGEVYGLRLNFANSKQNLYSERFVYKDYKLIYEQETKKKQWYAKTFVWVAIIAAVILLMLVWKMLS